MIKYITRRILLFIPTLIAITLLGFVLISSAPGDPVDILVPAGEERMATGNNNALREERNMWRKKLGLNLPMFYFSISDLSSPDTLMRVPDDLERKALRYWSRYSGNWQAASDFYHAARRLRDASLQIQPDSLYDQSRREDLLEFQVRCGSLLVAADHDHIKYDLEWIREYMGRRPQQGHTESLFEDAESRWQYMEEHPTRWKKWIPLIRFYPKNRYHAWLFGDGNMITGKGATFSRGIVRGDFGVSYATKLPATRNIGQKIMWSAVLTFVAVFFGYLVSLPLGVIAARHRDSLWDRLISVGLYILYSLPNFFVAIVLLVFFSNPDYFNWFPSSGVKPVGGYPKDAGLLERIQLSLPYLVLPVICYTYATFAFLSRTVRVSMLESLSQDYVRTARAKGLAERTVVWKHALRNSLLPVITVFANIFPAAVGGSVILESIFTIPGMGLESYNAIFSRDYPVLVMIFMITGVLTMLGYLLSDILYAWADPRISYSRKK